MRRMMGVAFAMGLMALGAEAVGARALPVPDAYRVGEQDVQAPLAPARSEGDGIKAPHEAGDDIQASLSEGDVQAP